MLVSQAAIFPAEVQTASCVVQALFVTPTIDGNIRDTLLALISRARFTIDVAIYSFTDDKLATALIDAHNRGVRARAMMEAGNVNNVGSEALRLAQAGIPVKTDSSSGLFHHKFIVIDGAWVVTGSYNWSAAANDKNYENVVILQCSEIVAIFAKHFDTILWPSGASLVPYTQRPQPGGQPCDCTGPDLDCSDFATQAEAQACFEYCMRLGYGDVFRLDRDKDGKACESLP